MDDRKQLDKTVKTAGEVGLSYDDLMRMDVRKFDSYVDGYIARREVNLNDTLWVNHLSIDKLLQGISGDKRYKKPIEPIRLTEDKDLISSRNSKVYKALQAKGII